MTDRRSNNKFICICWLCVVLAVVVHGHTDTSNGVPYQAANSHLCYGCGPGEKVSEDCKQDNTKSKCTKCDIGTFSSSTNAVKYCGTCKECNYPKEIKTECSSTSDTVCQCKEGFYNDTNNHVCRPLTKCQLGQKVKVKGTRDVNTQCVDCPPGTTSQGQDATKCVPESDSTTDNPHHNLNIPGTSKSVMEQIIPVTKVASVTWSYPTASGHRCYGCGPGRRLYEDCTQSNTQSTCIQCDEGTYSSSTNAVKFCSLCKTCGRREEIESLCTALSNTVCQCKLGYYNHSTDHVCNSMTYCQHGQRIKRNGTRHVNTVCEDCPTHTFSTINDATVCTKHTACKWGIAKEGTATFDNQCLPAPITNRPSPRLSPKPSSAADEISSSSRPSVLTAVRHSTVSTALANKDDGSSSTLLNTSVLDKNPNMLESSLSEGHHSRQPSVSSSSIVSSSVLFHPSGPAGSNHTKPTNETIKPYPPGLDVWKIVAIVLILFLVIVPAGLCGYCRYWHYNKTNKIELPDKHRFNNKVEYDGSHRIGGENDNEDSNLLCQNNNQLTNRARLHRQTSKTQDTEESKPVKKATTKRSYDLRNRSQSTGSSSGSLNEVISTEGCSEYEMFVPEEIRKSSTLLNQACQGVPNSRLQDLFTFMSQKLYPGEWKKYARKLPGQVLDDCRIEHICFNNKDYNLEEAIYKMHVEWKGRNPERDHVTDIIKTLKGSIKSLHRAKFVEQHFGHLKLHASAE